MKVLYNGEYREYNTSCDPQSGNILNGLVYRKRYVGELIGDFEIVLVDYDWGLRKPINQAKCTQCGYKKNIIDLAAFRRGKGEGRFCECRHKKTETQLKVKVNYPEFVGQTINGFKLLSYESGKGFKVECVECGKQKWAGGKHTIEGGVECNHRVTNDYSDPKWLSLKVGYLTPIERLGRKYRFRCDCGTELIRKPSEVFRESGGVYSCGKDNCEYHRRSLTDGDETRKRGIAFEFECADELRSQGFEIEMTPSTGDYGVDFFATIEGERVAFQCKMVKIDSTIRAVQEVYAGGRYYDCCKFVVVSPSGFTRNAELMASKLGVQLEKNLQGFRLKGLKENKIETQRIQTFSGSGLIWEIEGIFKPAEDWCEEYGLSRNAVVSRVKKGMNLETALTKPKYGGRSIITIDGVTKTKQEWCDEYGISPQLYNYRVKYAGLSPIEALTKKKGA